MKPVWRVFWDGLQAVGVWPNSFSAAMGTAQQVTNALVTANEVTELDDYCVVKRIVGEIYFAMDANETPPQQLENWGVMHGILIADESYTASDIDVSLPADAQDSPWMFLRTYRARGTGTGISYQGGTAVAAAAQGSGAGIVAAHIDVKVGRALRAGDQMLLYQRAMGEGPSGSWEYHWAANLRILLEA